MKTTLLYGMTRITKLGLLYGHRQTSSRPNRLLRRSTKIHIIVDKPLGFPSANGFVWTCADLSEEISRGSGESES